MTGPGNLNVAAVVTDDAQNEIFKVPYKDPKGY